MLSAQFFQNCPGSPVLVVLFFSLFLNILLRLSHSGCPILAVLFYCSCPSSCGLFLSLFSFLPSCIIPAVPALFCRSGSACPFLPVLFCLFSFVCPVLHVLFCMSCSACPVLPVLFCLSCFACPVRTVQFCLIYSTCLVLPVLSGFPVLPSWCIYTVYESTSAKIGSSKICKRAKNKELVMAKTQRQKSAKRGGFHLRKRKREGKKARVQICSVNMPRTHCRACSHSHIHPHLHSPFIHERIPSL